MAKYRVLVSDRAKTMLGTHIKFLAAVSPAAARITKTKILAAIRTLADMPERCPFLDEDFVPRGKYHKLIADSRYIVLFRIMDKTVNIDYIVDSRQDYRWLIH